MFQMFASVVVILVLLIPALGLTRIAWAKRQDREYKEAFGLLVVSVICWGAIAYQLTTFGEAKGGSSDCVPNFRTVC
jgi:drug/metabolite transporter (DMT)-like permease